MEGVQSHLYTDIPWHTCWLGAWGWGLGLTAAASDNIGGVDCEISGGVDSGGTVGWTIECRKGEIVI